MSRLARIACAIVMAAATLALAVPPAGASAVPRRLAAYEWAVAQRGKPYEWAGTGPWGFDCSGLVMEAYLHAGIRLPRTTYAMLASPELVRVPASQARVGDLAFYGAGHVELRAAPYATFGALDQGTAIGWHRWGGWWQVTAYYRVRLPYAFCPLRTVRTGRLVSGFRKKATLAGAPDLDPRGRRHAQATRRSTTRRARSRVACSNTWSATGSNRLRPRSSRPALASFALPEPWQVRQSWRSGSFAWQDGHWMPLCTHWRSVPGLTPHRRAPCSESTRPSALVIRMLARTPRQQNCPGTRTKIAGAGAELSPSADVTSHGRPAATSLLACPRKLPDGAG